eukprot:tig00020801_g13922.t1
MFARGRACARVPAPAPLAAAAATGTVLFSFAIALQLLVVGHVHSSRVVSAAAFTEVRWEGLYNSTSKQYKPTAGFVADDAVSSVDNAFEISAGRDDGNTNTASKLDVVFQSAVDAAQNPYTSSSGLTVPAAPIALGTIDLTSATKTSPTIFSKTQSDFGVIDDTQTTADPSTLAFSVANTGAKGGLRGDRKWALTLFAYDHAANRAGLRQAEPQRLRELRRRLPQADDAVAVAVALAVAERFSEPKPEPGRVAVAEPYPEPFRIRCSRPKPNSVPEPPAGSHGASPSTVKAVIDKVTVTCTGWGASSFPLTYTVTGTGYTSELARDSPDATFGLYFPSAASSAGAVTSSLIVVVKDPAGLSTSFPIPGAITVNPVVDSTMPFVAQFDQMLATFDQQMAAVVANTNLTFVEKMAQIIANIESLKTYYFQASGVSLKLRRALHQSSADLLSKFSGALSTAMSTVTTEAAKAGVNLKDPATAGALVNFFSSVAPLASSTGALSEASAVRGTELLLKVIKENPASVTVSPTTSRYPRPSPGARFLSSIFEVTAATLAGQLTDFPGGVRFEIEIPASSSLASGQSVQLRWLDEAAGEWKADGCSAVAQTSCSWLVEVQ